MGFGQMISTRSVCEFPMTWSETALEVYRVNRTSDQLNTADCTRTYGEFLGAKWVAFQVCIAAFNMLYAIPVLLVRLYHLRHFAALVKRSYLSLTQAKVYFCGLAISLALFLEMIDPLGFHGILPTAMYFILDELIAGCCFVLAIVIVDFWCLCAKGMRRNDSGLPLVVRASLSVSAFLIFVGCQITGMIDYNHYFIWEGVKMFGASALLFLIAVVGWHYVRKIERSLTSMAKSSSALGPESSKDTKGTDTGQEQASGVLPKLKSFRTGFRSRSKAERVVQQLKQKYRKFFALVILACLIMLANGALSVTRPKESLSWGYDVLEVDVYVIAVVLKVIYSLAVALVIHFFHVPKQRPDNMQSSDKKTGTGSKNLLSSDGTRTGVNGAGPVSLLSFFRVPLKRNTNNSSSQDSSLGPYTNAGKSQVQSFYDLERGTWSPETSKLLQVLENTEDCQRFLEFCRSKQGHENVLCFLAIQNFEEMVAAHGVKSSQAQKAGQSILTSFILPSAAYPVNVSSSNHATLRALVRKNGSFRTIPEDAFMKIKREIFDIMESNFYEDFVTSSCQN